jgi:peptide/nickel transport system substrate-binding protein
MMYPQLRAPSPAVIGDAQLRRALMLAIDRQELAETLTGGFGSVAHSIIEPTDAEYPTIESRIVRYPFDPAAAARAVEGLGFRRVSDGAFQDARGETLSVEIRTTANDANQKALAAVADYWTRLGVATEQIVIPNQLLQDAEYRALYPGFELVNQSSGPAGIENLLHSSAAPLPERNYRAPNSGKNRGAYTDPTYDAIMDRYQITVPERERRDLLGQLVRIQTENLLVMGLFYSADAILMANRLQNAPAGSAWNSHEWEVR